jgi:hypothetical protein
VTIVRVGTTKKYSEGWESAFGKKSGGRTALKAKKSASTATKSKKKPAAKRTKR